jgi:hypothetical protein
MLQIFPLLALGLASYAILGASTSGSQEPWYELPAFNIRLMSGDTWHISGGHLFIMFSMLMLFIEILRSTRSGRSSLMNHALSVLVFIVALLLFITMKGYGNSTFFIYTAMTFLDFMAGFVITAVTSRRDFALNRVDD